MRASKTIWAHPMREIALFSGENRAKTPSRINVIMINTAGVRKIENVIA